MRPALPRKMTVGEHPTGIDFDPAGSGKLVSYADRVDHAADALHAQFRLWLAAKWGDVPADKQKPPTTDEQDFIVKWVPWYSKWKAYRFSLTDGLTFWSPSAEWDRVLTFDQEEEAFRKTFAELTKGTNVKPPPPPPEGGTHESPGGEESDLLKSLGLHGVPWFPILTLATVGVGGYIAVNYWQSHKASKTSEKAK